MITTAEVARIAGVTGRMIRWWVERGVIKPRHRRCGPGRMRFFDDDQIFKMFIVRELRRRCVALDKIRRLKLLPVKADYLLIIRPQRHRECKRDRTIRIGNRVEWASGQRLIEHVKRIHSPVMLISIYDLRMEYAAAMERRNGVTSAAPPPDHRRVAA